MSAYHLTCVRKAEAQAGKMLIATFHDPNFSKDSRKNKNAKLQQCHLLGIQTSGLANKLSKIG